MSGFHTEGSEVCLPVSYKMKHPLHEHSEIDGYGSSVVTVHVIENGQRQNEQNIVAEEGQMVFEKEVDGHGQGSLVLRVLHLLRVHEEGDEEYRQLVEVKQPLQENAVHADALLVGRDFDVLLKVAVYARHDVLAKRGVVVVKKQREDVAVNEPDEEVQWQGEFLNVVEAAEGEQA